MTAQLIRVVNHFSEVDTHLTDIKDKLQDAEMTTASMSAVERYVKEGMQEMGRKLIQAQINLRSALEPRLRIVRDKDDIARESDRRRERSMTTIFGEIDITRRAYEARGKNSLFVLDAELNLPPQSYSHEVERSLSIEASRGSFSEATEAFKTATGIQIPRRQAEEITVRAASDFDSFYQHPYAPGILTELSHPSLLVLTVDGKGIVMRQEDLRDATRKKAENAVKKLTTRLSRGEKKNAKRMATVAAVYEVDPYIRKPEEIIRASGVESSDENPRPKAKNKRVWASVEKPAVDVIRDMFDEAERRDPAHQIKWVCLVDGAKVQMDLVEKEAKRRGITITIVLDMIHVLEYIWKAARVFFDETSKEGEEWVREKMLDVLNGNAYQAAAGMRRSATFRGLDEEKRIPIDKCADYLQNNVEHLSYDEYLRNGFPIASGVIEGTCRYLVKDRMEITGARWSLKGAEAILKLRALRASGDFSSYWKYHEEQELMRNHKVKLKDNKIPSARLRLVRKKL